MTVGELREALSWLTDDTPVLIYNPEFCDYDPTQSARAARVAESPSQMGPSFEVAENGELALLIN